jgi:uncharacterized protein
MSKMKLNKVGGSHKATSPNAAKEPQGSGFPRFGTFNHTFQSHESIAQDLSSDLHARRSAANYDYLAGQSDELRPAGLSEKFSYHNAKKTSGRKSYDYLDEDQNRAPPLPYASTGSLSNRGNNICFDSESDDEEAFLDHQIRMLEAKKAAYGMTSIGNPGPIGMIAFGMSCIQFGLYNTLVHDKCSVVPALSICFGGGTEMIVGVIEWVKGNTFAYVSFTGYGAFWLSLVCIWMLPNASNGGSPEVAAPSLYFVGVFYFLWALFSLTLTLCTLRMNVAIFLVYLTIMLMFFLLAGGCMAGNRTAVKAAGYEGVVCGALAMYMGVAEVLNEVWDRTVIPVIPMTQLLDWIGATKTEEKQKERRHEKREEQKDEGQEVPNPEVRQSNKTSGEW